MMHPPPPPPPLPPGPDQRPAIQRFSFWMIIGCVFSLVQFGMSEALHQIGMSGLGPGDDTFYELSDTIAFPAGELYDKVQIRLQEQALLEVAAGGDPFTEAQQTQASEFLERFPTFPTEEEERAEVETFLWDITELEEAMTVSTGVEYGIYVGTCLCWGLLISLGGYLICRKADETVV